MEEQAQAQAQQPQTTIQTNKTFEEVQHAFTSGFTAFSAQGGARSGKTYNIVIWLLVYALQHPGTKITVARATLPALKKTVLEDFKTVAVRLGFFDDRSLNKTDLTYHLDNGSRFEFISTDSEQKLRGGKRDILFINEANELRHIEYQQLKMRTTVFTILDYNPSFGEDHWISSVVNTDSRTYYYHSTYKDNPFLEQNIIDEIEGLRVTNPALWQVYGEGNTAKLEGLIYPSYTVVDEIPSYVKRRWYGADYGFTIDPTAIIEVGLHKDDLYISEVCYKTEMLPSEIIAVFKELYHTQGRYKIISESAEPRLVQEIYNAGLNIHPVKKYPGSINAGINKIKEFNINVTAGSKNIIKELKYYTWSKDKDGGLTSIPVGGYDHALDALRYVVLSEIMASNRRAIDTTGLANALGR